MDTETSWYDESPSIPETSWYDDDSKMLPQSYETTQGFNDYNPDVEVFSEGGKNTGVDVAAPSGTPVTLPSGTWEVLDSVDDSLPGWIGNASNQGWGGSALLRDKNTGYTLRLSHLSKNNAKTGDILQGGFLLGATGTSGNSSGDHISIDIQDPQGNYVDPHQSPYAKAL